MGGLLLSYAVLFLIAGGAGFAIGAAFHRSVIADPLLDLDGDVQSLRIRVTEAKSRQDAG